MSQIAKIRRKKHEKQVNCYVNVYEFSQKEFAYWSRTRMEWNNGDEKKKEIEFDEFIHPLPLLNLF